MIKQFDINKIYFNEMKVRYAMHDMTSFTGSGVVADSYYPAMTCNKTDKPGTIDSASAICISPNIANKLGMRVIPILELIRMLGYTEKDIKALLLAVKSKHTKLLLIGAGGTGANFIHWMNELCSLTNTLNIFDEIKIFDNDKYSLTNIHRIPMHLNNTSGNLYKADILQQNILNLTRHTVSIISNFDESNIDSHIDYLLYGAPDIPTREFIYNRNQSDDNKIKFVSATHGGDMCLLQSTPLQNQSLQVESYGLVDLSYFFMNHLKMTISFLELIKNDIDFTQTADLMEYNFRSVVESSLLGKTKKTYRFTTPKQENIVDEEPTAEVETMLGEGNRVNQNVATEVNAEGVDDD